MLAMSDINIEQFLPLFAEVGVSVAFLVPTPNGYKKSIMDAIGSVRDLLKDEGIHDYELQDQGPSSKIMWPSFFVTADGLDETEASLYRPVTKKGDPRIWFKNLRLYCRPKNLLSLFVYENRIYVLNLSDITVRNSLNQHGFVYDLLQQIKYSKQSICLELLYKIKNIHDRGFLPTICSGDCGVGDTLEHELGIERNNLRAPDYKGIELKATRLTRHGQHRIKTRSTLFTRVPDQGLTYRQIVETYGKWQTPRKSSTARLQLYETFTTQRINSYGLGLEVNDSEDRLEMKYAPEQRLLKYVSSWQMVNLKNALLLKHHETFWVKAVSEDRDGKEFFRYDKVLHTKNPNIFLLPSLLEYGKITLDLAAHSKEDGSWRDHGMLFKMKPEDIGLLLGNPIEYDLATLKI